MKSIFIYQISILLCSIQSYSINHILRQVILELAPYEIIFFKTKNVSSELEFLPEYPSSAFELEFVTDKIKNYDFSSRVHSIHMSPIILLTNDLRSANALINLLVKLVPLRERPPCLVILTKNEDESNVTTILQYAWKYKILDFTITSLNTNPATAYSLDPFGLESLNVMNSIENTELFPDKLKGVNEYPYQIGAIIDTIPNMINEGGHSTEWARNRLFMQFVLRLMNFKIVELPAETELNIEWIPYNKLHLWFARTNSNMLGQLVTARDSLENVILTPTEEDCRPMVAILPMTYVHVINVPLKLFIYIVVVPGVLLGLIHLMHCFNMKTEFEKPFSVIQIFLGQLSNLILKRKSSRIIFLTIIILFLFIAEDIYSDIIEIEFGDQEAEHNKFSDLLRPKLPVYSWYDKLYVYETYDDALVTLRDRTVVDDRPDGCINRLKVRRDRICVYFYKTAKMYEKKYRNPDGSAILQIAQPAFHCDDLFFQFEFASPYMRRFMIIARAVRESGIIRIEYLLNGVTDHVEVEKVDVQKKMTTKSALKPILVILVVGWLLAVLAFAFENSSKYLFFRCMYNLIEWFES